MNIRVLTTAAMALFYVSTAWAATCHTERLAPSTPTTRFNITMEVTVADAETRLSWMRCALGQKWNGDSCAGKAQIVDWQHAMAMVDKVNAEGLGGYQDWRMPLVPELASIVERQCFNPRMNIEVFPGAPSETFWTSMEKMGATDYVYTLDFGAGAALANSKEALAAVRLVRGGPWWQPPAAISAR